jgi:hypothetical protein
MALLGTLEALVIKARAATGYLPVRIDVDEDLDALLDLMTTGMRTIPAFGVPVFINTGLGAANYYYYSPTAPYTAVADTV